MISVGLYARNFYLFSLKQTSWKNKFDKVCFSFTGQFPISNTRKIPDPRFVPRRSNMELSKIVATLDFIIPLGLAESWDNVGLLIEPSTPRMVKRMILTIDLTPKVLKEAIEQDAELIFCYHPVIFTAMKKLVNKTWQSSVAIKCIEHKIAVYSSHTALDVMEGGVNDWLLKCFDLKGAVPLNLAGGKTPDARHVIHFKAPIHIHAIFLRLMPHVKISDASVKDDYISGKIIANEVDLGIVTAWTANESQFKILNITENELEPIVKHGIGRWAELKKPLKIKQVIEKMKNHLGVKDLRAALATGHDLESTEVTTIAVCAGSGAEVLRGAKADLYITGEMSHHETLRAVMCGSSVILCEHTNTERGYLSELSVLLEKCLPDVQVLISKFDKDPIIHV